MHRSWVGLARCAAGVRVVVQWPRVSSIFWSAWRIKDYAIGKPDDLPIADGW